MALSDFFRINFPNAIARDPEIRWYAFNREYMPLGWHKKDHSVFNPTKLEEIRKIGSNYNSLTEKHLLVLADGPNSTDRDEHGKITRIWFYSDGSNPNIDSKNYEPYIKKIKKLGKLEVNRIAE
ncbi:hypothetical protein HDE68_004189 [Pedobacter cryoconitis]|uniref:Uncharacterized protein n=1 Tax=Pedobacter cryoconitis TaxID=188932 RepID=A0A7W9E212_9SPHI|nr:hypothetical protein [Pedobacter cryoconitis]MBB5638260.1 hypothetical protein [Pedobacter cryoconitis]